MEIINSLEWYHYAIALAGAFVAGSVNTLAGNGSAVTLSILTELLGLPGNMANGTNRIGILFNGFGSIWGFHRGGKLHVRDARGPLLPLLLGAVAGAYIAVRISDAQFMTIFRWLMVAMLVVILVKPSRWLITSKRLAAAPVWVLAVLYFLLGIYGGVIQMGMGIFYLAVLVLIDGFPLIRANAVKVFTVTIYTVVVILLFQIGGYVHWPLGLLMAAGQFFGGWFTARVASKHVAADRWAYYFLVVIVVLSLASLFNII